MNEYLKKFLYVVVMLIAAYYIVQLVLVFSPASDIFAPR